MLNEFLPSFQPLLVAAGWTTRLGYECVAKSIEYGIQQQLQTGSVNVAWASWLSPFACESDATEDGEKTLEILDMAGSNYSPDRKHNVLPEP